MELWLLRPEVKLMETLPIRPAGAQHRSFILATWIQSYMGMARKQMLKKTYETEEPKLAEKLWSKALIITPQDEDFTVHGWVCAVGNTLYQCYVPPELRRLGIAGTLIKAACGTEVTIPRPWPFTDPPRGLRFTYNPYKLGVN